jgi:hypothetical protein
MDASFYTRKDPQADELYSKLENSSLSVIGDPIEADSYTKDLYILIDHIIQYRKTRSNTTIELENVSLMNH